jgi:hypothetical protein
VRERCAAPPKSLSKVSSFGTASTRVPAASAPAPALRVLDDRALGRREFERRAAARYASGAGFGRT